jgi:hypothetical protein
VQDEKEYEQVVVAKDRERVEHRNATEEKSQQNKKCKVCAEEDIDAGREEQCSKIVMRLVSH